MNIDPKLERNALDRAFALERAQKGAAAASKAVSNIDSEMGALRDVLDNPKPRDPFRYSFKDPENGYTMRTDCWYILSDSGSAFAATGFASKEEALIYALAIRAHYRIREDEVVIPAYTELGAWVGMSSCNILLASDVLDYWKRTDLEYLLVANADV